MLSENWRNTEWRYSGVSLYILKVETNWYGDEKVWLQWSYLCATAPHVQHTHLHTNTQTQKHTNIFTYRHTHIDTYTHVLTHTHIYTHTNIHANTHVFSHITYFVFIVFVLYCIVFFIVMFCRYIGMYSQNRNVGPAMLDIKHTNILYNK